MAAHDEAVEDLGDLGGEDLFDGAAEEGTLAAGVHHLGEGAVGEDDAAVGVEGGDAVGDGLEHGLELAAAGFEGGVGGGELDGGVLDGAAAVFEVGGHVVEAADEFAELFGGALADAVGVVSGGDGLHGVGERFDGLGDLLGEMQREPAGGEEREAGHHQQQEHVEVCGSGCGCGRRSSRPRRRCADGSWWRPCRRAWAGRRRRCSPCCEAGGAEGVVDLAEREDGLVVALGGGEDGGVGRIALDLRWLVAVASACAVFVAGLIGKPGLDLRGGSGALRHVEGGDDAAIAKDDGEAVLQGDLMLAQDLLIASRLRMRAAVDVVHERTGVAGRQWLGVAGAGGWQAMESASARALAVV